MSDRKMHEIKGRITISRYAKKEARKKRQGYETRWHLWITRLYSGVRYFEGEYKIDKPNSEDKYIYDVEKTKVPEQNYCCV